MNAEINLTSPTLACTLALQWGRVLMNAEIGSSDQAPQGMVRLQWGRVLMNAEMPHKIPWNDASETSFNGAAFL